MRARAEQSFQISSVVDHVSRKIKTSLSTIQQNTTKGTSFFQAGNDLKIVIQIFKQKLLPKIYFQEQQNLAR